MLQDEPTYESPHERTPEIASSLRSLLSVVGPKIAKTGVGLSIILFFLGFLLLCSCPEWYATAAALAGLGVIFGGSARFRAWSAVLLFVCLLFTEIHYYGKINEEKHLKDAFQRLKDQASTAKQPDL